MKNPKNLLIATLFAAFATNEASAFNVNGQYYPTPTITSLAVTCSKSPYNAYPSFYYLQWAAHFSVPPLLHYGITSAAYAQMIANPMYAKINFYHITGYGSLAANATCTPDSDLSYGGTMTCGDDGNNIAVGNLPVTLQLYDYQNNYSYPRITQFACPSSSSSSSGGETTTTTTTQSPDASSSSSSGG